MSEENKKRYDAFISYRHSELDSFVAINLQRKLENFKLPKNVQSPTGKNAITRVFRDEDELPIASSLSEQIENALNETDFLIVICTPRLPESKWCEKEMETFIKLYGREKILAVLAEGEPSEAFPKILTTKEVVTIDSDGNEIREEIKVEPLAADVRGTSKREMLKKMDDAILRIAAPVFEINYDDLKQRHRERKMKRIISIVSFAAACMLVFSLVCMGMLIRISKQSDEIAAQNDAIQKQNEEIQARNLEIEAKNKEIEDQYVEAAKNYAISMVESATKLTDDGRNKDAIYALSHVMPDSTEDTSIPYTSESLYKMTEILELYPDNYTYYDTYEIDAEVIETIVSEDGNTIALLDDNCKIHIFDIDTGEGFALEENAYSAKDNEMEFLGNDYLLFINKDREAVKQSLKNTDDRKVISDNEISYVNVLNDKGIYCLYREGEFNIYNIKDDSRVVSVDLMDIANLLYPDGDWWGLSMRDWDVSDDSRYLAGSVGGYEGDAYFIYDFNEGKITNYRIFNHCMLSMVEITPDNTLYLSSTKIETNATVSNKLYSVDCKNGKENWNKPVNREIQMVETGLTVSGSDCVVAASDLDLLMISKEDGTVIDETDFIEELGIVKIQVSSDENLVRIYSKNCSFSCYLGDVQSTGTVDLFTLKPSIKINDVVISEKGMLICPQGSTYVTFYKFKLPDLTYISDKMEIYPYEYSRDGKYYLLKAYYENYNYNYGLYDTYSGEKILSVNATSTCTMSFIGEEQKELIVMDDKIQIYNVCDGSLLREITPEYHGYVTWNLSQNCNSIYCKDECKIVVCSLEDGHIINETNIDSLKRTEKTCVVYNDKIVYINEEKSYVSLYDINTDKPAIETVVSKDIISTSTISDDGRYLVFIGKDRTEFYDTANDMNKTVIYNENIMINEKMKKVGGRDYYLLRAYGYTILLDENMKPFMYLPYSTKNVDYENHKVIILDSSRLCAETLYEYDDIIRIANERIGDYVPPKNIIEKYNIFEK